MKKILNLIMLPTLLLMAVACNKNDAKPSGELLVNNNKEHLSQRVNIYRSSSDRMKAAKNTKSEGMPACPTITEADYDVVMDASYKNEKQIVPGTKYYIPVGTTVETRVSMDNNVFYIAGEFILKEAWAAGGNRPATFVVLPGGKINIKTISIVGDSAKLPNRITLLNYGEMVITNYAKDSYRGPTNDVPEPTLYMHRYSVVKTVGSLHLGKLKNEGSLYVEEGLDANTLELRHGSDLTVDCGVTAKAVQMYDSASFNVNGYLEASSIAMNNKAKLYIASGSLASTESLVVGSEANIVEVVGPDYGVLEAKAIRIHEPNKSIFRGWLDIQSDDIAKVTEDGEPLEWLSTILLNGNTKLASDDFCKKDFDGGEGENPDYVLDHIAEIACPDNKLSATSVQVLNDRIYVSYHIKGDEYGGSVDVFDLSSRSLLSNVNSSNSDFNYLTVNPNQITVVGADRKFGTGAFLGTIALQGGIFSDQNIKKYEVVGSSANGVIRNGNYLMTSSNRGFQTFDAESMEVAHVWDVDYAKHLDLNNGKFVSVHGVDDAQINIFDASDVTFSSPLKTIVAGKIFPKNGKNVCKLDGDRVYLCKGEFGMDVYENGVKVWNSATLANGMDYDDKYIYIAGTGLHVYDRNTFEIVATYANFKASANYVSAVGDGYIYVAYGTKGSQLFRLVQMN